MEEENRPKQTGEQVGLSATGYRRRVLLTMNRSSATNSTPSRQPRNDHSIHRDCEESTQVRPAGDHERRTCAIAAATQSPSTPLHTPPDAAARQSDIAKLIAISNKQEETLEKIIDELGRVKEKVEDLCSDVDALKSSHMDMTEMSKNTISSKRLTLATTSS